MRRMPGVRSSLTYRRPASFADSGGGNGFLTRTNERIRPVCRTDRRSAERSWRQAVGNAGFIRSWFSKIAAARYTHARAQCFTPRVFRVVVVDQKRAVADDSRAAESGGLFVLDARCLSLTESTVHLR